MRNSLINNSPPLVQVIMCLNFRLRHYKIIIFEQWIWLTSMLNLLCNKHMNFAKNFKFFFNIFYFYFQNQPICLHAMQNGYKQIYAKFFMHIHSFFFHTLIFFKILKLSILNNSECKFCILNFTIWNINVF